MRMVVTRARNELMKVSRERKLRHFYSVFKEGQTVIDVGVASESRTRRSTANLFLKNFRHDPKNYTGLSVRNIDATKSLFPEMKFVQYAGGVFPFKDNEFGWAFSNAVIEHVGDERAQLLFVNEMLRVARNVFFTTPNKYFPVESHTDILFLHWVDPLFYGWCRARKKWVSKSNLYLLSSRRLKTLLNSSTASTYRIYKNRTLGMPMTFTVIAQGRKD